MANHAIMIALQPYRPDEVVQRHHHLHAVALDAFGEFPIVGERGLVESSALRLHPRPRDGETEQLAADCGGGGDVFLIAVPKIRGTPTWRKPLAPFPEIPDIFAEGVVSLDLMVRVSGTEEEVLWEFKIQNSDFKF